MSARPKGKLWYADFAVDKQRFREFGFARKEDAEAWELEARAAIMVGKPIPPGPGAARQATGSAGIRTIKEMFDHVAKIRWAAMKTDASKNTAGRFVAWVGPLMPVADALTPSTIHDYIEYLRDDLNCSGSTVNRHLSAISRLAKAAHSLSLLDKVPDMPWQKEGEGRIRWFTEEEEEELLTTLRLWGQHTERDLFIFLVDTGARLGEALKLTWQDVASGDRAVTFWETKAGNHRSVPLTGRAREAVARRRSEKSAGQAGPFTHINRWTLRSLWERLRTRHGFLSDAVIHTFRHTCASRLVQKGVDLMRVRMWMGHKAIQTTLRYAHLAPKHLDDVLRALEGGGDGR